MSAFPHDADRQAGRGTGARPGPLLEGRRVDPAERGGAGGEITYTVVVAAKPVAVSAAATGEKRDRPRQRTRLRTGKLVDAAGRFLTECLIYDRSEAGGRLRLPAGYGLTTAIQLYEDQSAALWLAEVVWRTGRDVGVRLRPAPATARTRALEAALRRRFYAVPD